LRLGFLSGCLFCILYLPSEIHSQPEIHSRQPAQPANTQPNGSLQSPFFVQVIPAPQTAEDRAQEAEDREEKKSADRWLVRWTAALFIATVGLILATGSLGYFAFRQMRDMEVIIAVAEKSADAAKESAAAAAEANRLNRDAFIVAQRPWIAARVEPGPIEYNVNGLNVGATFIVTNSGRSPATHVNIFPQVVAPAIGIDQKFNPTELLRKQILDRRSAPPLPWGSTIHQDHSIVQSYNVCSISREELSRITQKVDSIHLSLLVVIEYRFVFDGNPHFTAFCMEITRKNTPRPDSTAKNRWPAAIFPDEGNIPANELVFRMSPVVEEYAD
jgi:hypothetical protein